jgi:adenosylcobinamide kinase/adenosylcobinamide-phosphate guanylyltransferase
VRPFVTFILGGSRSGKSSFAERLASEAECPGGVLYIATADSSDSEMASRIEIHRRRRPDEWRTWEGDMLTLSDEIGRLAETCGVMLMDCLTMYLTRLFLAFPSSENEDEASWREDEKKILDYVRDIFKGFAGAASAQKRLIVVSGEVGCGVVPSYQMGRRFRDLQGRANQIAAERADEVALVVAGIPMWIKREKPEDMA